MALTIWLTGLPSSGKTTIAMGLAQRMLACRERAEVLDGDVVRRCLTAGLGFSRADREENARRVGWVANLLSRDGVFAICALVSPYRSVREEVRRMHSGRFLEVYVSAPLEVCEARDVKGLYARQRKGELKGLTGIDDPYEPPYAPDVVLPTHQQSPEESVDLLWTAVRQRLDG
jgi:adenylylsulfate kinase